MKTLITDPFEDDARSILEWAYGDVAVGFFNAGLTLLQQRTGQSFMNTLARVDPESYERLSGSLVDPFYQDVRIPAALDLLTSK